MALLLPLALALMMAVGGLWLGQRRTKIMLDHRSKPLAHPALGDVCARLAQALDLPQIDVLLLEIEGVNGLADAEGRIFLTQGFLRRFESGHVSADELGAVIAHELGHVAQGHMRRRMIDVTGGNTLVILAGGLLNRVVPIVGPWLVATLGSALIARLSRRDEFEADAWAAALLIRAGLGVGPLVTLLRKLEALTEGAGAGIPDWLKSHPSADERIRAITAHAARWQA